MANVYAVTFAVLGFVAMYSSLLVCTALLLPGPVDRARWRLQTAPLLSFGLGLVCWVAGAALAGVFFLVRSRSSVEISDGLEALSSHLQFARFYNDAWILTNILGWLLTAPLIAVVVIGSAGFARLFAARARPLMVQDRPLAALILGAACLSFAFCLPFIGWYIFLPIVAAMSGGAGLASILDRRSPAEAQPAGDQSSARTP